METRKQSRLSKLLKFLKIYLKKILKKRKLTLYLILTKKILIQLNQIKLLNLLIQKKTLII